MSKILLRRRALRHKWQPLVAIISLGIFLGSCDPEGRKSCDWYIVPDTDRKPDPQTNLVPVCARNYVTNKQDCRLEAPLDYAKKAYMKRFRYVDLEVVDFGLPRQIKKITFCR